jgi:hypothetical protein
VLAALATAPATAAAAPKRTKVVSYHGYRLTVPASWPVFRLNAGSTTCVRFNRHAVYLGAPSSNQQCPAHTVGRTEAILVEPTGARASRAHAAGGPALPAPRSDAAAPRGGSQSQLIDRTHGLIVTATWGGDRALMRRALHVRALTAAAAARPAARPRRIARLAQAAAQPGAVYTGLGFDPCATPSAGAMLAWSSSPYRAVGVYIGGANMACSQPNLTTSWVGQESAAGWHLIPIYVGLQAPTNSCGCASISPGSAATQGAAAARDAVSRAQEVGLGPGNPLYFDMEAYTLGRTNTSAVLAFLGAWTSQLHSSGYKSGVYSSADSGIVDLVSQYGTGYVEPDDIWIARWNNAKNTSDPNVPSADWAAHQRLHQYDGGHDETHGGVTINIDGDFLDGSTAAAGSGTPTIASAPSLSVSPAPDGGIALEPSWNGAAGISSWQLLGGGSPLSLAAITSPVSASTRLPIVIHSAYPYFEAQALGSSGQPLGSSAPVATPGHVAIFGNSVFVARHGLAGIPVGCFSTAACSVTSTITSGRALLARTTSERVPVGGGLVFFSLTNAGHATLARAHRLAVRIAVRDASGASATRRLNLVSFTTSGRGPRRDVTQSSGLKLIGATYFVSQGWLGGILAGCFALSPCHISTTITAGAQTVASTGQQFLGVNQLGYLFFSLTATGHRLLASARGNQLPVRVTITTGSTTATAHVALVSFR